MSPPLTTIAIVEDDASVRSGWTRILDDIPGYRCIAEVGSGEQALVDLPPLAPEIVLMDINLPGISGVECTRRLKVLIPETEVLMLTMYGDRDLIFEALRAGAGGYLLKRTAPTALKRALNETKSGGAPMSPQIARKVINFFTTQPPPRDSESIEGLDLLSPQQAETLGLLAKGYQYKQIADTLGISIDTVRTYIRRIYRKLHVHSRTEAVAKHFKGGGS